MAPRPRTQHMFCWSVWMMGERLAIWESCVECDRRGVSTKPPVRGTRSDCLAKALANRASATCNNYATASYPPREAPSRFSASMWFLQLRIDTIAQLVESGTNTFFIRGCEASDSVRCIWSSACSSPALGIIRSEFSSRGQRSIRTCDQSQSTLGEGWLDPSTGRQSEQPVSPTN